MHSAREQSGPVNHRSHMQFPFASGKPVQVHHVKNEPRLSSGRIIFEGQGGKILDGRAAAEHFRARSPCVTRVIFAFDTIFFFRCTDMEVGTDIEVGA